MTHPEGRPEDWVCFAYVHHPAYLLRVIPAANAYKEYMSALLLYESLRLWLDAGALSKVSAWPYSFTYLTSPEPAVGGGL